MNTLVIGYNHTVNDKRVMRTVNTFKKMGKVYYQYSGKYVDNNDFVSLPLLKPSSKNKIERLMQRRNFDCRIMKWAKKCNYDLAYFHGFPSTMPTKVMKEIKKQGKKIVYDLHEIMPVQYLPERLHSFKFILWKILKKQFKYCDGIVSVSDEALDYMIDKTGAKKPSFVLSNYASFGIEPKSKKERKNEIVIAGKSQYSFKKLDETGLIEKLKESGIKIKTIGIKWEKADKVLPYLPYGEMMKEISESLFSIIYYSSKKNPKYLNFKYSLPNKFYDSLAAGTPILLESSFFSMSRLIKEIGVGVIIDNRYNVDKNSEIIKNAISEYDRIIEKIRFNQDKFVWEERKEKNFLHFIEKVVGVFE